MKSGQTALGSVFALPSGARYYRCALQVNPYAYVKRHRPGGTPYADEAAYNAAIVAGCLEEGIEVIAVMDHYRVEDSISLIDAALQSGITVFPGFEAVTKDGVHMLCLFDPSTDVKTLERYIGACGVHDRAAASPTGAHDVRELLEESPTWNAVCVAAHVAGKGGLLRHLSGSPRINAWRHPQLMAVELPGPVSDAPDDLRPILENKNAEYRRERPVAVINAHDVCSPDDLREPSASCWIKMSEVSNEGLRQAFLDPQSRIRLASDPEPEPHTEFLALAWQGGFLDGAGVHFNENLNVLIGGRGTGKSTIVESLRYVLGLEPLTEDARVDHEGIVRHVLRSGTKVSLAVQSYAPSEQTYLIERTVPNPAIVRDAGGKVLPVTATDVVPQVEVYGQHEISELAKKPEKLTLLLERFVERDANLAKRKADLRRQLQKSRSRVLENLKEREIIDERLASLPALEETLRRFHEAGLEEKLKEQTLLVREERVLKTAEERLAPLADVLARLREAAQVDRAFLTAKALEDLPGRDILMEADGVLARLEAAMLEATEQAVKALDVARAEMLGVRRQWEARKASVQRAYEAMLRELQQSKIDGEEYMSLRRQKEDLLPLGERRSALQRAAAEHLNERRGLLAEWEDVKAEEFRLLEAGAKRVCRRLKGRVRVQVTRGGDRRPLEQLLRDGVGGRLSEAIDALRQHPDLSLPTLVAAARQGADALVSEFGVTPRQAQNLAGGGQDLLMQLEELDLPSTAMVELNVAAEGESERWQSLDELSTGQKATAILLLLLLESDAPLVVDQPEDDLDNRFISDVVVPKMREEKRRRQFIFSTHNANIPVLGDAELIIGLAAAPESESGKAKLPRENMGSIDSRAVKELVEEVLEGGRDAFETRRAKYGF